MINVTIWNENLHEKLREEVRQIYPRGIHGCLAEYLEQDTELCVRTATFDDPEHGLTERLLERTDVLIYWSHMAQEEFSDAVAQRIQRAVLRGMGLIALHSAHYSKMMRLLMGTSMTLRWRHGDRERLFVTAPAHPIAAGLPEHFELPVEEMYGEYFDIPKPDDVVFTGWFAGGEVFRSGCTFQRGQGRIFYFQPGHEMYPTYYDPNIRRVIRNAVYWCAPLRRRQEDFRCRECLPSPEEVLQGRKTAAERETVCAARGSGIRLAIFYEHIREAMEQTGKSLEEVLDLVRRAEIRGVELDYSVLAQDPGLVGMLREHGLEVSGIYQFFEFGTRYAAGLHLGRKMITCAQKLGIPRVMVIPGFLEKEAAEALNRASASYRETAAFMENCQEIIAMRDALAELTEYGKERGIQVSMEDFDSFTSPIARMNPMKWFLDQVPGLGHTLDMGNYVFSDEDVREAYELLKDRVCHVHCKDRGMEEEKSPELWEALFLEPEEEPKHRRGLGSVPVGEGYLPIKELVERLKDQKYQGYLAIEHFGAPDQLSYLQKSAEYLNSLLT